MIVTYRMQSTIKSTSFGSDVSRSLRKLLQTLLISVIVMKLNINILRINPSNINKIFDCVILKNIYPLPSNQLQILHFQDHRTFPRSCARPLGQYLFLLLFQNPQHLCSYFPLLSFPLFEQVLVPQTFSIL